MINLRTENLSVGDRIRHTTFGKGLVTKCKSAPGDIIVTIAFDNNSGVKRFLLNHTPLEKIGGYKAPLEKIEEPTEKIVDGLSGAQRVAARHAKEHKSPQAYTTEFKIEVVKQALSEGRAVVRKHYGLPETTLRGWIKQFNIVKGKN